MKDPSLATQSFRTTILVGKEKNVTGIELPDDVITALGAGKRPRLHITINGYTFTSTVGSMGGRSMISLSAVHRQAAGVAGADAVEVQVTLAPDPPTVTVPEDLLAALG